MHGLYRRPISKSIRNPAGVTTDDILLLFPGALGDFACFWPTLQTLRQQSSGRLTLVVRPELFPLLPGNAIAAVSIDRREVADLFSSGPPRLSTRRLFADFGCVESWTGHGDANFAGRLAQVTGGVVSIHPFRGMRAPEHASEYYARCAGVRRSDPHFPPVAAALSWTEELWAKHGLGERVLVVHAGSGSVKKNWEGMGAVAKWWRSERGGQVVELIGAAEAPGSIPIERDATVCCEPLDRVAALLQRAHRHLGNDSGISHLAGLVGAHGLALFGPTDPVLWKPLGDTIRVVAAPAPCPICAPDRFCVHRLPADRVCSALTLERADAQRRPTENGERKS